MQSKVKAAGSGQQGRKPSKGGVSVSEVETK
jgi:hypothetical protein